MLDAILVSIIQDLTVKQILAPWLSAERTNLISNAEGLEPRSLSLSSDDGDSEKFF